MLTDIDIHTKLLEVAESYEVFQCETCADEMQTWLSTHNISGRRLILRTYGSDFMISNRVGGHMSITQNGYHHGIETREKVYDNLPESGISRQEWLDDFDCISGFEVIEQSF